VKHEFQVLLRYQIIVLGTTPDRVGVHQNCFISLPHFEEIGLKFALFQEFISLNEAA